MIGTSYWPFKTAIELGDYMGITGLVGKYGYTRNLGSTPNGMTEILQAWNWVHIQRTYMSHEFYVNSIIHYLII